VRPKLDETMVFSTPPSPGAGEEYRVPRPDGPGKTLHAETESDKLRAAHWNGDLLAYLVKDKNPPLRSLRVRSEFTASPVPEATGAYIELDTRCPVTDMCLLQLTGLPPGSSIQILGESQDNPRRLQNLRAPYYPVAGVVSLNVYNVARAKKLRIRFFGEASQKAALSAWQESRTNTSMQTQVMITPDGIARYEAAIDYRKSFGTDHLTMFSGAHSGENYLFSETEGIEAVNFSALTDSFLILKGHPPKYGYSVINAVAPRKNGGQAVVLPLPAVIPWPNYLTQIQEEMIFFNWHRNITVTLPPALQVKPVIMECSDLTETGCGRRRSIPLTFMHEGNRLVITPEEAQVTGLWYLALEVTAGRLQEPDFWTRIKFGFAHYHRFGTLPGWVATFYSVCLLCLLLLILLGAAKLNIKKSRRKALAALAATEVTALEKIKKQIPDFSAEAFRNRVRVITEKIQESWCAGDMRPCRPYLSQGVYDRFRLQLRIMREFEFDRNMMQDFRIDNLTIYEYDFSRDYHLIVVRLEAEARDITVALALKEEAALRAVKKAKKNSFVEYYSFARKRHSPANDAQQIAGSCGRCGTPFPIAGQTIICRSCSAVISSGDFDWVLTEITQEIEFKKGLGIPFRIYNGNRIEDRASFLFWRFAMVQLTGNKNLLTRDATIAFLTKSAKRARMRNFAVGAAELEDVIKEEDRFTATVRLKWSATDEQENEPRHRESLLTLVSGKNDVNGHGFAEHSCESCGAPLPETDSDTCAYCKATIAKKNPDWLLDSVSTTVE